MLVIIEQCSQGRKVKARDMLRIIKSTMRYLARQGLAFCKVDFSDSNVIQLLELRAEDIPKINDWLAKSRQKYTSPDNQNEMWLLKFKEIS